MRRWPRGIALVSVFMMMVVLAMMVVALMIAVRGEVFASHAHYARTSALYVAEAGLAESLAFLEDDKAWPGVVNQEVPEVRGYWSVTFRDSGPFGPGDSVNNLAGTTAKDSHRGAATVPPGTALLVVKGQVPGGRREVEALVSKGGFIRLDTPILASGHIRLRGEVSVDGVKSLKDSTPVDVTIHSNLAGSEAGAVSWSGDPSDSCYVGGKVTASSESSSAIQMSGATITQGMQAGMGSRSFPPVNVEEQIQEKSDATPPTVNSTGPTILEEGDYYHAGDLVVEAGEVHLKGANLYVNGNLEISGSITGSGSIFTKGKTVFMGDSSVDATSDNVAVFSRGSIELSGFDSDAYLDSVGSADPQFAALRNYLEQALNELQTTFKNHDPDDLTGEGETVKEHADRVRRTIGQTGASLSSGWSQIPTMDILGQMIHKLESQPESEARDRVVERLKDYERFFEQDGVGTEAASRAILERWERGQKVSGILDSAMDVDDPKWISVVSPILYDFNTDSLGSSAFTGVLYTNGYFSSVNNIKVTGAVLVNDDGSQPSGTVNGETIDPGDLFFDNGSRVSFVEDFFDDGELFSALGTLGVGTWMGR